jgi:PKD repeat protein
LVTGAAAGLLVASLTAAAPGASAGTVISGAPVPDFTHQCVVDIIMFTCVFDGSASGGGTIVSWQWDFGDGGSGSGQQGVHRYEVATTYQVTLKVTDDGGLTGTVTKPVPVP